MQLIRTLFLSSLVGALSGLSAEAHAQKSYALGITAGAAIPTGKFGDAYSAGAAITGFLAWGLAELPVGVRLDGMYHTFSGRSFAPPGGGADVSTPDLRLWGAGANLVVTASGSTTKPYFVVGAGYYNSKVDSVGASSKNHLGFSGGVGSTFSLGPLASVVEVRFHSISRKTEHGGSVHFVPVLLGITF